MVMGIRMKG